VNVQRRENNGYVDNRDGRSSRHRTRALFDASSFAPVAGRLVRRATACRAAGIVALAALLGAACASGRPSNRFIRYGDAPAPIELMEAPVAAIPALSDAVVAAAVGKAKRERGEPPAALPTAETTNDDLRAALRILRERPSAVAHLRAAQAYARLGVRDFSMDHYDQAIELDPASAAAYDGRARIWRDWKVPGYAIGDAQRAVYYAPRSAAAQNTLGTVLLLIGSCRLAEAAFKRALVLEPTAGYAVENLEIVRARMERMPAACRGSDAGDPLAAVSSPAHVSPDGQE
jgi:tetratricopeptide (TPR) repeat protein